MQQLGAFLRLLSVCFRRQHCRPVVVVVVVVAVAVVVGLSVVHNAVVVVFEATAQAFEL